MRPLVGILPPVDKLVTISARAVGGYLLEAINGEPETPYGEHPKNIRNSVDENFGSNAERVWVALARALSWLEVNGYTVRHFRDNSPDWFALTDEGRKIKRHEQLADPVVEAVLPLAFVSCGQRTALERELGQAVSGIVHEITGFECFFAQDVQSLEGLHESILTALRRASLVVFIMQRRGEVHVPDSGPKHRASVWIEQEVAIAAYRQFCGEQVEVRAYIEAGIELEGIRSLLALNAIRFDNADEIIKHLRANPPRVDSTGNGATAARSPRPFLSAEMTVVTPHDAQTLG